MAQDNDTTPGGTVELLSIRHAPKGRSALAEIEAHWRELRGLSGRLPRRADLDAGRIAGALPFAFVAERAAPGVARLRIAGRALIGLLGDEARGLPLSMLFHPQARPTLQDWTRSCLETPALVDLPVTATQGLLRPALTGRLLLLPMLDAEGGATRILGGLLVDGAVRRAPARFEIDSSAARCEPVRPASPAWALPPARAGGLGEAGQPYLRLVVSNP